MSEMQTYMGTKAIRAKPMTRGEYNTLRVWDVPEDENPDDEGYLVEYLDGGYPNLPSQFEGYISWSPKDVFERAYQPTTAMSFGHALVALEEGKRVCRAGWNGKGMFLFLVPGSTFKVNRHPLLGIYEEGTEINYHAHIDMRTADGKIVPWLTSQTDALAKDWMILTD